jgi:hypothetical protein
MANLPVAQLGYMPNLNAPSHVPTYQVGPNFWERLGADVLSTVLQQGIGNLMTRDYASRASTEGLVPNEGGTGGPQNDPWYKRMLTGPAMSERQYLAAKQDMSEQDRMRQQQTFTKSENEANRKAEQDIANAKLFEQIRQFDATLPLEAQKLGLQQTIADRNALIQGGELDVARQNAATRANPPSDPDVMVRVVGSMANDIYKVQMEQWQMAAAMARAQNQPPPPQPTFNDAMRMAVQGAQQMGFGAPQAVTAPAVPLVDPAALQFNFGL